MELTAGPAQAEGKFPVRGAAKIPDKSLFVFLSLVFLLAACTTTAEERPHAVPENSIVSSSDPIQQVQNPAPAIARSRPNAAGPRKPMPPLTLTSIVGRDEAGTIELLGKPGNVRVESPATIWVYSRGACDLEIYFYPSLRERRLQSLTYEISGPDEETDCLKEFGLAEDGIS